MGRWSSVYGRYCPRDYCYHYHYYYYYSSYRRYYYHNNYHYRTADRAETDPLRRSLPMTSASVADLDRIWCHGHRWVLLLPTTTDEGFPRGGTRETPMSHTTSREAFEPHSGGDAEYYDTNELLGDLSTPSPTAEATGISDLEDHVGSFSYDDHHFFPSRVVNEIAIRLSRRHRSAGDSNDLQTELGVHEAADVVIDSLEHQFPSWFDDIDSNDLRDRVFEDLFDWFVSSDTGVAYHPDAHRDLITAFLAHLISDIAELQQEVAEQRRTDARKDLQQAAHDAARSTMTEEEAVEYVREAFDRFDE